MPFPTKQLRVFPNPWLYIDHLGRPAGRVQLDAFEHSPTAGAVGATMTDVKLIASPMMMRVANTDMEVNPAQHDHRFVYAKDAVSVPPTNYYRAAIKNGELVAADKETAAEAGIKFVEPATVLAKLKAEAIAKFDAETAENAYARFGSVEPLFESPVSAGTIPTVQAPAPAVVAAKVSN